MDPRFGMLPRPQLTPQFTPYPWMNQPLQPYPPPQNNNRARTPPGSPSRAAPGSPAPTGEEVEPLPPPTITLGSCDVKGKTITIRALTSADRWRVELSDKGWKKPVTSNSFAGEKSLTIILDGAEKRTLTARVACQDPNTGEWTKYGEWLDVPREAPPPERLEKFMPPVEPEAVTVEEEVVVEAEPPAISSTGTVMLSKEDAVEAAEDDAAAKKDDRKVGFTISEGGADPGLARAISFAPQAAASKDPSRDEVQMAIDQAVAKHEQDIADGLPASAPPPSSPQKAASSPAVVEKVQRASRRSTFARARAPADTAAVGEVDAMNKKWLESGVRKLFFAEQPAFRLGLEGLVGMPHPKFFQAMEREHCVMNDSRKPFKTPNYHIETTSEIEWFFVVEPTDEKLAELRLDGKPIPKWPDAPEGTHQRSLRPLNDVLDDLRVKNDALEALGEAMLISEEAIAARLYTGPVFLKYNGVLRALGEQKSVARGEFDESTLKDSRLQHNFNNLCNGSNKYATTIHLINSAILKISHLSSTAPVYRGLRGNCFNTENVIGSGGVEQGFLSTTRNPDVARAFAGMHDPQPKCGVVFAISQGRFDRGAELDWLSQYPYEKEVLFAPVAGVEVLDARLLDEPLDEEGERTIIEVDLRITVNMTALPVEKVVSKTRSAHLQLVDILRGDLLSAGVPSFGLGAFDIMSKQILETPPSWYNDMHNFNRAVADTLTEQREMFYWLAEERAWLDDDAVAAAEAKAKALGIEEVHMEERPGTPSAAELIDYQHRINIAQNMRKMAHVAARSGEHYAAIHLLQSMQEQIDFLPDFRTNNGRALWIAIGRRGDDETKAADGDRAINAMMLLDSLPDTEVETEYSYLKDAIEKTLEKHNGNRQLLSLVDPKEQWRLRVAARFLAEGCTDPWPPTLIKMIGAAAQDSREAIQSCFSMLAAIMFLQDNTARGKLEGTTGIPVLVLRRKNTHLWRQAETRGHEILLKDERGISTSHTVSFEDAIEVLPYGSDGCGALLRSAALLGEEDMVKGLVEVAGTSLREADPQANIAYHVATIGGHAAVNSFIQKQGKKFADDILLRNMESRRPLDLMFLNHHADLMRINRPSCNDKAFAKLEEEDDKLLAHDGKHKLPPDTVFPTLHSAVLHGSTAHVINFLNHARSDNSISLTALVNEKLPVSDLSPLMLAARAAHAPTAKAFELLRAGADLLLQTSTGVNALSIAAETGVHSDLVRMLLGFVSEEQQRQLVTHVDEMGESTLYHAAYNGDAETVRMLLELGADPDVKAYPGASLVQARQDDFTPLMRAAIVGHSEVAATLLEHGADAGEKVIKNDGFHPMLMAALQGQRQIVAQLLRLRPAAAHQADHSGLTPLMAASKNGHTATVRLLLLAEGARKAIDTVDATETSALMWAIKGSHAAAAKVLMAAGANAKINDVTGNNPIKEATKNDDDMCIKALGIQRGKKPGAWKRSQSFT